MDWSDALVFSAKEASIAAGAEYELRLPIDAHAGSYVLYEYEEASGEGVTFSVRTADGRPLLDELLPRSSDQLHIPAGVGPTCTLTWANSEAWLGSVTLSYTVRVVSTAGVRAKLERRLLQAAARGSQSAMEECLAAGVQVDCKDESGLTPLLHAALTDGTAAIRALLAAGASVNTVDRHGNQPLHLAAISGASPASIRALLERGALVDARNGERATPLALATLRSHVETATALLDARADATVVDGRGNTTVHVAAANGHAQLLDALLAASVPFDMRNQSGESALCLAAKGGHTDALQILLRAGAADKMAASEAKAIAHAPASVLAHGLLMCCREGLEGGARLLLDAGAPLDVMAPATGGTIQRQGPLALAVLSGCAPIVSLLLRHAKGRILPADRLEALDAAAASGNTFIVDSIIHNSDVDGSTPGMAPPAATDVKGAVVQDVDPSKQRALYVAAGAGRTGLVLVLLNSGARPEVAESAATGGGTALHAAAAGGHTMTALALLRHGCSLSALDAKGRSAPTLAIERGHEQTALTMVRCAGQADMLQLLRLLERGKDQQVQDNVHLS
jgi:ankyrin repeat protein